MPAVAPPAPAPTPISVGAPFASPAARVYVLNGVDPFGFGGLREMTGQLQGSGYDTRFGAWYQSLRFEREIRQLHREQPGTPVAIIGYSFGTYWAKGMANRLTRDGIPVAMVGYIGGDYLRNTPSSVPSGPRVVNVMGNGFLPTGRNLFFNGTDLTGAENLRLRANHFDLPKQQQTLDALLAGLGGAPGGTVVASQPSSGDAAAEAPAPPPITTYSGLSTSPAAAAAGTLPQRSASRPLFRMVSR
jgi:hypothetical protein